MSLSRALAGLLSSSKPRQRLLLRPVVAAQSSLLSTQAATSKRTTKSSPSTAKDSSTEGDRQSWASVGARKLTVKQAAEPPRPGVKHPSELPRPSVIPFQPKVANLVHLVGTVGVPVQMQAAPSGAYSAVTVLVREKTNDYSQFWIPVIFQGDLAHIAACHLNESDRVYITGQLTGDAQPFTNKDAQADVQVLAQSLNFVRESSTVREVDMISQQKEIVPDSTVAAKMEENSSIHSWNDLFANPHKWLDIRLNKSNPTSAAFEHKDSGFLLWIDNSTPEWVLSKLDNLSSAQKPVKTIQKVGSLKKLEKDKFWSDLVNNPQQWQDKRIDKLNGLVNPKFPDFRHKDNQTALWVDTAPDWVLSKLDSLDFTGDNAIVKQGRKSNVVAHPEIETATDDASPSARKTRGKYVSAKSENSWKDLVENPKNWWDNRPRKFPKSPDFKHKETGEGLWLGSSTPSWVLPKLPPVDSEKVDDFKKVKPKAPARFSQAT